MSFICSWYDFQRNELKRLRIWASPKRCSTPFWENYGNSTLFVYISGYCWKPISSCSCQVCLKFTLLIYRTPTKLHPLQLPVSSLSFVFYASFSQLFWHSVNLTKRMHLDSETSGGNSLSLMNSMQESKESRSKRLYTSLLLLRRIVLVTWLICCQSFTNIFITLGVFIAQIFYMVSLFILRPYQDFKDNLIECINEVFFTVLIGILFHFNSAERWSDFITKTYVWIMMANNTILLFIVLSKIKISYSFGYESNFSTFFNKLKQELINCMSFWRQ